MNSHHDISQFKTMYKFSVISEILDKYPLYKSSVLNKRHDGFIKVKKGVTESEFMITLRNFVNYRQDKSDFLNAYECLSIINLLIPKNRSEKAYSDLHSYFSNAIDEIYNLKRINLDQEENKLAVILASHSFTYSYGSTRSSVLSKFKNETGIYNDFIAVLSYLDDKGLLNDHTRRAVCKKIDFILDIIKTNELCYQFFGFYDLGIFDTICESWKGQSALQINEALVCLHHGLCTIGEEYLFPNGYISNFKNYFLQNMPQIFECISQGNFNEKNCQSLATSLYFHRSSYVTEPGYLLRCPEAWFKLMLIKLGHSNDKDADDLGLNLLIRHCEKKLMKVMENKIKLDECLKIISDLMSGLTVDQILALTYIGIGLRHRTSEILETIKKLCIFPELLISTAMATLIWEESDHSPENKLTESEFLKRLLEYPHLAASTILSSLNNDHSRYWGGHYSFFKRGRLEAERIRRSSRIFGQMKRHGFFGDRINDEIIAEIAKHGDGSACLLDSKSRLNIALSYIGKP